MFCCIFLCLNGVSRLPLFSLIFSLQTLSPDWHSFYLSKFIKDISSVPLYFNQFVFCSFVILSNVSSLGSTTCMFSASRKQSISYYSLLLKLTLESWPFFSSSVYLEIKSCVNFVVRLWLFVPLKFYRRKGGKCTIFMGSLS